MFKFFYSDCVLSDLQIIKNGNNQFTYVVSAKIDGRAAKRLVMDKEMYNYFTGVGAGTKNRIWFLGLSFLGSKKGLILEGIENEAGERFKTRVKNSHVVHDLVVKPPCLGFLVWFMSWIILFIPVAILVHGDTRAGNEIISQFATWAGIAAAVWMFVVGLRVVKKTSSFDSWSAGDVSAYTTAVKPAFGSGLAALKK